MSTPSGAHRAAEVAKLLSETCERSLAAARRIAARKYPYAPQVIDLLLHAYGTLDHPAWARANQLSARMDKITASLIDTAVQDETITRRWRRHRVVYAVDPDLAAALTATDPDSRVPCGELLRMLPHPDPFVAFPEPIPLPVGNGEEVRHLGFYLYGMNANDQAVSTCDPTAAALAVMSVGLVYGQDGEPMHGTDGIPDLIYSRMTLPATTLPHRDLILDVAGRFRHRLSPDMVDTPPAQVTVPALLQVAVPLLVYLCAQNADRELATPREITQRRGRRAAADRLPTVVKLGFRLGPKLNAARRASGATGGVGTGQRVRPHVRRAHWHTFRTGKGRQDTVLHWLPPIPVHPEEQADVATVVAVD